MRKITTYMALVALGCLVCLNGARGQSTSPSGQKLPPSIILDLRKAQAAKRGSVLRDTIKLQRQATDRQASGDTALAVQDSALVLVDTSVPLLHKEWLDSQMVEIPELSRFGSVVHFDYPVSIMVETDVNAVPFDSTLLLGMNPITRENLPFFDQSPIPLPLNAGKPFEAFAELGGGNLYQPLAKLWGAYTFSPRTSGAARLDYETQASPAALHSYLDVQGSFDAQLGTDPGEKIFQSSDLALTLGLNNRKLAIIQDSNAIGKSTDHTLSQFRALASLTGDATDHLHYEFNVQDREWKDDLRQGSSESSQDILVRMHYDPYISHFRLIGEAGYQRAALTLDTTALPSLSGVGGQVTNPMSGYFVKGLFGRRKGDVFEWYGGVEFMGGAADNGTSKENYSALYPVARIRIPLNPRWELGASFEPQMQLASQSVLTTLNPFYSPYVAFHSLQLDSTTRGSYDMRSVVMDRVNLNAFTNYFLSPDDEIRLEARYIDRQREPVFDQRLLADSTAIFTVVPRDTRRFQFTFSGNFLLFTRDVLTGTVDFSSATIEGDDRALPFEPSMKLSASYHMNSFSETIHPAIEFRSIARKDRTLSFLNAEVRAEIIRPLTLLVRVENLLGGPDDFWTGYSEYPRSIWASIRYAF